MEQKKDWKAKRLYMDLSKAKTEEQKYKIQLKIKDYFFKKRRENEGNENK